MTPPLAVRNLTSTPIVIKRVERFEDPNTLQSKASGHFSGSKHTTSIAPSAPQLGKHANSFQHRDLDIALAPFESYTLTHPGQEQDQNASILSSTTLRLTIESPDGGRYRIDTNPSYTQKSSQSFTPLSPNPPTSYTALFHPSIPTAHLTIHTNHLQDYRKWMSTLPDTLPLSALSIPGTHNSHTHHRALPSVRCQVVDVKTQLENGIRFLDIRVQPAHATDTTKKDLYLVHGAFPVSLTGAKLLAPLLQICYAFLARHPSETIIVSLKREGVGAATDQHLARILQQHYFAPHATNWHTSNTLPYLGAARGKLILLRRYHTEDTADPPGLDATSWPHNATHALLPEPNICIQDFCEIMVPAAIALKATYANEHLVRAAGAIHHIPGVNTDLRHPVPMEALYLNFLSGSNFWKVGCWPGRIARVVNRGAEEWVCGGFHLEAEGEGEGSEVRRAGTGDGSTGVVIMDCG
ncbi:1-phosphatidylinositol phosphodiesterase precursor [Dothidotthia symphoricarpi CBS 119687]|uniref:1-phosphatidylinositol phosphodiesterase n=1 Tax=Dothidotthia symphoricarpi CBS 119687 TaxID=1392245 RepID=A0A6A6AL40_9PLEO|nr:1-phosphatidylinositol phosphodiesterase precursor [Dothidotthia symphoricarpi CBS 119687]KAF2131644.1 1-phosphatidylinositol phosphodiesterase precursor [Dothidotthia symphoricarpi CBS 119687]